MKRVLALAVVAMAAATIGAATTAAVQDEGGRGSATTSSTASTTTTTLLGPEAAPGPDVLLAWAQGGLPQAAVDAAVAAPGVRSVAVVRDGRADLVGSVDETGTPVDVLAPGWRIALDVAAVDPVAYSEVVPIADKAGTISLGPNDAILGATSAALRRIGPGGRLDMAGGVSLNVIAVVPDAAIGAAEVVVDVATGERLGVDVPRAVLVSYDGDRAAVEAAVVDAVDGLPVRFRAPGETPYLRAADSVLPQSIVKAAFGEFSYRPLGADTRDIEIDPAWVTANIVDADVPVLGTVRCHRAVIDALTTAMASVDAAGLGDEFVAQGFDGCFVPRLVSPGRASLSRHAWGIAFDVGYRENPTNASSTHDERVVELLGKSGFAWGGTWLVLDPAHFEIVAPPNRV